MPNLVRSVGENLEEVPTVRSLSASLGRHLQPAAGTDAPEVPISGVHISELADPTPYLGGGELLLTTGLNLFGDAADTAATDQYVERLARADVVALGFGLGPAHDTLPSGLADACGRIGMPLLVVPEPTPFITISRAYWTAAARSGEQLLIDQLGAQRALVDAATSPDPTRSVLRTLARWLGGWAATLTVDGEVEQVHPDDQADEAASLQGDLRRLESTGAHSAASFVSGNRHVAVFPLTTEPYRTSGFLAVSSSRPMDAAARRTVLTGVALLSLVASQTAIGRATDEAHRADVATLLDLGHVDAARSLAAARGEQPVADRVRVLVIRSHADVPAAEAVARWCPTAVGRPIDSARAWFVVDAPAPAADGLARQLRTIDPDVVALLSATVRVEEVAAVRPRLLAALEGLDLGLVEVEPEPPSPLEVEQAVERLLARAKPALVEAVVGYLRHRGHWEPAARDGGMHRNTLRYRVARAAEVAGVDLDDPDVAAQLWLALRRRGAC